MIVGHIGGAGSPYEIQKSLRFRASASAYLSRTPGVAGNRQTWTWSGWVKRGALGVRQFITMSGVNPNPSQVWQVEFDANNKLDFYNQTIGTYRRTTQVFRDVGAWYHIVFCADTNNATAQSRFRCWVNGVEITAWDVNSTISSGYSFAYNGAYLHGIGAYTYSPSNYFDGYLTEINFIDGHALDPSYFGQVSAETGAWIPKKYTGTYGTNGFYLPFNDGSTLGNLAADRSGNGNNWTANNISLTSGSSYDWMDDTPTNNFAVLNPLAHIGATSVCSNGNLQAITGTTGARTKPSAISVSSGLYYVEVIPTANTAGADYNIGISKIGATADTGPLGYTAAEYSYQHTGNKYNNNSSVAYGSSYTTNDVIGVLLNLDSGTLSFTKNDVSQGVAFTGLSGEFVFLASDGSSAQSSTFVFNFGQRPFAYSPPTGFKALCTKNLPTPSILNPKNHFDVVLATGANIKSTVEALYSDQALMVVKDRANANNWQWFNDVTGLSAILQSNTTSAETTYSAPTGSSVGYGWKAGGAAVTNTAGSIQSQVSANPQAGFSIVTYTGTGANATVGHGLGVAPKMVIVKDRDDTFNWVVWHTAITGSEFLRLNTTDGKIGPDSTIWNSTVPSATVISLGANTTATNVNTKRHAAYCFAEIPGYSKIGSYTGNGSADGPFVYCGFRPRWVLYKRTDAVSNWYIVDTARNTANSLNNLLLPNSSQAEFAGPAGEYEDFLANGFKLRTTSTDHNALNGTYIFIAFAEAPFPYANAR